MTKLESRIAALEETVARIVEQLYTDRTWERPAPPPPTYPETTAAISSTVEAASIQTVYLTYRFNCATCGQPVDGNLAIASQTPNPCTRLLACGEGHKNKVVFHVKKDR